MHALWVYAQHNHSLVSIVLAPERRTWPAYCLTKIGFKEISKCKVPGFHKHKKCDSRLYKEAEYVLYDESTNIIFEDFRFVDLTKIYIEDCIIFFNVPKISLYELT